MTSHRLCALLACFLPPALVAVPARAQSSLRCAGSLLYDTDALAEPVVRAWASGVNTLTMRASGRMFVSGSNDFAINETQVPNGLQVLDVDFTGMGGAAVLSNGSIVTWGRYNFSAPGLFPTLGPPPPLPSGITYSKVARGSDHGVALRSDNAIVCWGNNFSGQCNVPPIPTGLVPILVRCGPQTSYAVLSNGVLLAWGDNYYGQTNIPSLPPGVGWVDIRLWADHMVALRTDGMIMAWGDNTFGQCNVPALPPGTTYAHIAAGMQFSCAARSDGVLVAWGRNDSGQCNVPSLPAGTSVAELSSGEVHTVVRLSNGQVLEWGGYEHLAMIGVPTIAQLSVLGQSPTRFRQFERGAYCTVGVLDDDRFFGFGSDAYGMTTLPSSLTGVPLRKAENKALHTAVLTTAGQIHCWGDNSLGACNVPPLPSGVVYTDVTVSESHTVGLRSDGQAIGWGNNSWSELMIPPVQPPLRYTKVDADFGATVLLRSDGAMVHVGLYYSPSTPPYQIHFPPAGVTYTDVATTRNWAYALRSDGQIDTIGSTSCSGLQPPMWCRAIPPLPLGLYWVDIEGGNGHAGLRRSDGRIFGVGFCQNFQDYIPALEPNTSYVEVRASYDMVCGRVGPPSTFIGFAPGCAGTRPATRLVPGDTPAIGRTLELTLFDLPLDIAMIAMGWSRFQSPIALTALGMPGCDWHVALDGVALLAGQNQQAQFSLPIPDQPSLVGIRFYHQALVLDPAANAFGAVVSEAAEGVVGDH